MNETSTDLEGASSGSTLEPFPWPPQPNANPLDAFITTWKQCCFQPTSFFRRMPREGSYGAVLAYYLVIGVVVTGIQLFWSNVLGSWSMRSILMREERTAYGDIIEFLLSPLILLFALFLVTAVCHVLLLLVGGARHGYQTSSRVFAFSYSPGIFAAIPMIGGLIAFIWMTALAVIGLREAHDTSGGRAAVAVLVPVFLLVGLMILTAILAMMMGVLRTPI